MICGTCQWLGMGYMISFIKPQPYATNSAHMIWGACQFFDSFGFSAQSYLTKQKCGHLECEMQSYQPGCWHFEEAQ